MRLSGFAICICPGLCLRRKLCALYKSQCTTLFLQMVISQILSDGDDAVPYES